MYNILYYVDVQVDRGISLDMGIRAIFVEYTELYKNRSVLYHI